MALLRIPFGSACRNDALEKRYFPNFDGVLVNPSMGSGSCEPGCIRRTEWDIYAWPAHGHARPL
jgi:hypothetical protein